MDSTWFQDLVEEIPEYFPTSKFLERFKNTVEEKKHVISELNFSGIQYLTDEIFYGLLQKKSQNKDIYEKIVKIDCRGCLYLTDQALKDIGNTFTNLSEIHLDGCREITHQGLLHLGPAITKISAIGCNICVPVQIQNCQVICDGCPLIVSQEEMAEEPPGEQSVPKSECLATKVAVLMTHGAKFSVSKFLNNEEQIEYDDIEFRSITKDNESALKDYFNVFECQTHASFYSPLLSSKSTYILGLQVDSDLLQNAVMGMNYVKGLEDEPVFILLLLYNKDTVLPMDGREQLIATLAENIKERLDVQNINIDNTIEEDSFDSELSKTTDFCAQQRFGRTWRVKDKNKAVQFYIYRVETDTQRIGVVYPTEDDDSTDQKETDLQELSKLEEELNTRMETWTPTWENALQMLNSLNKSDITEMKSFKKPPVGVLQVMTAVLIIFENNKIKHNKVSDTVWPEAKLMMTSPNFLRNFLNYPKENMSLNLVKRLSKFLSETDLTMDQVRNVSRAASSMFAWVMAINSFGKEVLPFLTKYKALKQKLEPEGKTADTEIAASILQSSYLRKGPKLLWKRLQKLSSKLRDKEMLLGDAVWKSSVERVWSVLQDMKRKKKKVPTATLR